MAQAASEPNLLPNSGFNKAKSGYWPDWWNWYNALGNEKIDLDECWQLVDEHHVPDTRSIRLAHRAVAQTSYIRVYFQKGMPLTFSAWMKSDKPDTKVDMAIHNSPAGWTPINEETQVTVGTEWKRCHVTTTVKEKSTSQRQFVRIALKGDATLWINAPQLEEGDTPTAWKPSPKDAARKPDTAEAEPAEPKFPMPKIDCVKIDRAPVIDGKLDDPAWKEAGATETFVRLDEDAPAKSPTDAYVCRDDDAIYVAFRCHEPEMDKLTAKATLRDAADLFRDDCVEVFLSANEDGSDYLRFATNARGTRVDSKGYTKFFDTDWECAAHKDEDFWSAEFRLPLSSLERPLQPGTPWRLNLARYRARPKEEEYSAWAPVVRTFHDSTHFGFVYGIVAEVGRRADADAAKGALAAYLDRSFYTTEAAAGLFVDTPEGTPVRFTFNGVDRQEKLPATRLLPIGLAAVPVGRYPIKVSVGSRSAELVLRKLAPKANAVKIDRLRRIFLVDDKPFIPIGTNVVAKRLPLQADLGFTCSWTNLHSEFTREAQDKVRRALDAAEERGMRIIVWYWNNKWINDPAKWQAELLELVEMFKDHPALFAWFVFDEPRSNIQWLKGLCDAVREADPYHPPFINWCDRGHGWTREMGDVTGDVNCLDGYYMTCYDYTPNEAFLMIGGHCTEMTADAKTRGNVVAYINGLHGWATAIREPSPLENRFVTYVSLIRGARMFLYYNWGPPANPALRESFKPLCREFKTLASVVANPEAKDKVACDNERIDFTVFETPEGLYIIALNTDENDEKATFRIQGATGDVDVLFEDRQVTAEGGAFRDRFSPLERHVYRLEGALSE